MKPEDSLSNFQRFAPTLGVATDSSMPVDGLGSMLRFFTERPADGCVIMCFHCVKCS